MNLSSLTDEELIDLLKEESSAAFEEIYSRYWARLYSAAYKRLKVHEVAEELVQDLFTSLWVTRNEVSIRTSLAAYLETSIRYRVFNYFSKEYVRRDYQQNITIFSNYDNSTEESILFNDLKYSLESEINSLPAKCRYVYELSRKEYKTNKEIAVVLGISEKTVENHLTKALKRLRMNLGNLNTLLLHFLLVLEASITTRIF